jgi:stage V sporulation protein AD
MAVALAQKRVGKYTVQFLNSPKIIAAAGVVGPKEGEGPLSSYFDAVISDEMYGQNTAEKAERRFLQHACDQALNTARLSTADIDLYLAGDLLNQLITATFTARRLSVPYVGIYNACATLTAGLALSAMLVDGDYADRILTGVSSHYQTAERQFRYPVELNIQRKKTNQRTVTGAGAAVVAREGIGPRITHATLGRVVDYDLKDANDMGAAMAPAAADTFLRHLEDTDRTVVDYDLVLTGDLANNGKPLFNALLKEAGISLENKHQDAGALIYSPQQQVQAGGSGAACSAAVFYGYVLKEMADTRWRRVLLIATGSLHSPLSCLQGESIPCIAHAVAVET